jgi:hypothetical protein
MLKNLSSAQNHILSKLKNADSLRYTDLKPEKVPNDLFNYHLQSLVKKGLVARFDDGYSLSASGIKHVADPYPANDAITSLFKINVITIVSRKTKNGIEILSQRRTSNPSYGKIGVPGGVVLKGELTEPAAARKLKTETGLDAEFTLLGCERRIMYMNGEIFSDILFPIAYTDAYAGELIPDTVFGHNMWVPIDEAIENESAEFDSIVKIKETLEAIRGGKVKKLPFFFSENIQKDS